MIMTVSAIGRSRCALLRRRWPQRHRLDDYDGDGDRQVPVRLVTTAMAAEVSP